MADNSVISRSGLAGLFGIPGVDLRQQQEEKDAFSRAELTPTQQLSARVIGQGKAAGRELAGLLGAEDPMMKEQSAARQARLEIQQSGLQPNSPEFWDALTVRLGELGAPNAQAEASNIGLQVKEKAQKIATDRATEQLRLRDQIKQVGLTSDGRQVYQSGANQFILTEQGPQPYYGSLESKQSKTEVNVGGLDKVFSEAFSKAEGKDQAEAWRNAGIAYGEASKLSKNLREVESLVGKSFVGPYGSLQAGVSRVFGGSQKLSNTEIVDALTKQLVVPLVKQFPGSLAVKELDTLMKTTPNIAQKEETIRRLLGRIQEEVQATELAYEAGERYRKDNKGSIVGFNPNIANNKSMRFVELKKKFDSGKPVSEAERKEAKAIADELKIPQ